eukprot:4781812-Amphidinium_carterae.4
MTLVEVRKRGGINHVGTEVKRVIIELCCENSSLLGQRTPRGTLVVRVTEEDDMNNPEVVQFIAIQLQVSVRPVMLWVSVPCATGCTWLRTVPHVRDDPKYQKRAANDRCLAQNALTLVHCACSFHRSVCWEWPRFTDLWRDGVTSELERLELKACDVDGCAFNLMAQGGFIKKPWRIMRMTCH